MFNCGSDVEASLHITSKNRDNQPCFCSCINQEIRPRETVPEDLKCGEAAFCHFFSRILGRARLDIAA